ncbi:sialate O-acetylesterase [Emticicia sp. BO119]|uniref:sialate O-acetylesterase n=1 Tax=Emticicia sp. BO119 TaxID=2757768 RepID=UPI0015F107D8|nr:sialate O-acetylesterase [Emticicia sp. BO119]MBA4850058.1 sialate O-acetylesterase [Emticicia sp. BO119]
MKGIILALFVISGLYACHPGKQISNSKVSNKEIWVFLMAGQSNMAGRGLLETHDTITNDRILTIDKNFQIIKAREPIHFYEPNLKGLDCGLSFAQNLLKGIDNSITILIIPTAVGGSSSRQWLGDSVHRGVKLMTNFREKMEFAKKQGIVKGILWHQGESDANAKAIPLYNDNLKKIFSIFRQYANNDTLPILIGELGNYSKSPSEWNAINEIIRQYVKSDPNCYLINTGDLKHKGDFIHFNSDGQRLLGQRFAETYLKSMSKAK